ncbi:GGDEF domain-containing protein [Deinococcus roseus]|uniref:GGDEF domain-containing protein n=1 Tax=Deinococcus roseus TaxID=392414 RepID=A0ABQ2D0I0_9DEIO|nr:GGDEF domain-containing protein [Deinococcus roseus]GGJ38650.1 hypothetical protein GCM10008938_25950 [Deinococcus roseus]
MPFFSLKRLAGTLLAQPLLLANLFSMLLVLLIFLQLHHQHPLQAWIWSGIMALQLVLQLVTDLRTSPGESSLGSPRPFFSLDARLTVGWSVGSILIFQLGQPHTLPLLHVTLMIAVSLQVWRRPGSSLKRSAFHLLPLACLLVQLLLSHPHHPGQWSVALGFTGWGMALLYIQQQIRKHRQKRLEEQKQHHKALQELQTAHDQLLQRHEKLQRSRQRLQEALKSSRQMASTDELTGCLNRRGLFRHLQHHLDPLTSQGALLMLDLDHFKQINDLHGHPFGDLVLKTMVERIEMLLGSSAMLARYGGEEFLCVMPGVSLEMARTTAEHLRQMVACAPVVENSRLQWVTVSIGVSSFHPGEVLQVAIQRADQAMYQAKNSGRNRVQVMPTPASSLLRTVPPAEP